MSFPRALITGIIGEDGPYLAERLLAKGYEVWGAIRRSSSFNTARIDHLYQDPHDPGGRYLIVFNGEIYNYQPLRRDLEEEKAERRNFARHFRFLLS